MVLLVIIIMFVIIAAWGFFSGASKEDRIPIARTSLEDEHRNKISLINGDEDDSLLAEIHTFSSQGYRICFDDDVLLNNPELLGKLNHNTRICISDEVISLLEALSKTAKHGFAVKLILDSIFSRTEKRIVKFDDMYVEGVLSSGDISSRIIGAYLGDQKRNLHYNLFVTTNEQRCTLAQQHGIMALLA